MRKGKKAAAAAAGVALLLGAFWGIVQGVMMLAVKYVLTVAMLALTAG